MNQKIFDAASEFRKIADFDDDKFKEKDYAIAARKQMLDMLRKFFAEETREEFVTLFGIYCNHYIRCYLHQILLEKDFGVSELWDVISDENFQKYLLLIQHGIFEQNDQDFFDALEIFDEYSLPHLYLFVFSAKLFDSLKDSNNNKVCIEFMQEHYNKMNVGLREYVLGAKFIRENHNPALDENPLPYVKAVDKQQDFVFNSIKSMMPSCSTLRSKFKEMFFSFPSNQLQLSIKNPVELVKLLTDMVPMIMKLEVLEKIFNPENTPEEDFGISYDIEEDESDNRRDWRDVDFLVFRVIYLNIPVKISNTGSFLLDQMEKLRFKSQRDDLIADFTYTCKNLNATNLGVIAESLLKMESEQEKKWGRALLLEFARKDTLNKKVTMLNMCYEGDSKKLVETLEESLADEGNGIGILEVLQMSALYCFVEFFYDEGGPEAGSDARRMRKRTRNLWKDHDAKKFSFENEVIFNQKNCIDWMTENDFHLQINIDERWQKICLQRNDYAEVFFRDIFLEMIKNFLKYGEVAEPVEINLHSDESTLKISMSNLIAPTFTKDFKKSTNRGLIAMNNTLEILYIGKGLNVPNKSVRCSQDENFFVIELLMPAEIFLKGGEDR